MRRRKAQVVITIGTIIAVTVIFVIKVFAVVPSVMPEAKSEGMLDTATQIEVVCVGSVADVAGASPPIIIPEVVEYIPDVSDIEETYISDEAYSACVCYGNEYNILPELLMAMIERESGGNPNANNGTDSGLMQVAQKWHYDRMERLGVTDLFDTDQNIHTGADYLAELFNDYEDVCLVLMVYNIGYETANDYYSQGIISEYAQEVTARADELFLLHTYGGITNGKRD